VYYSVSNIDIDQRRRSMRINLKVLNIPPYISTSWKNIAALKAVEKADEYSLIVTLVDGSQTEVPHLQKQIVDAIFATHAQVYDMEIPSNTISPIRPIESLPLGFSMKMELPGFEGLSSVLQHNQEHYNSPNLPAEVLEKLSALTQVMGQSEVDAIPQPEPHCNCPHCQITRAIHLGKDLKEKHKLQEISENTEEELVTEEDLHFRTWDIKQTAEQLYVVTNPLDSEEQYNVFLGKPIGCTCGNPHCDHIKAVLSS